MKKIKIEGDGWLPKNQKLEVTRLEMLLIVRQWYLVGNPELFMIETNAIEVDEYVEEEIEHIYKREREKEVKKLGLIGEHYYNVCRALDGNSLEEVKFYLFKELDPLVNKEYIKQQTLILKKAYKLWNS